MPNYLLYLITVAIWGSTWLAIKYQLGAVDPMVSVGYRFLLASLLLMAYCGLRRLPMRFTLRDHLGMALQGLLLFALNYWLFYVAELTLTSGIVALVFSTMVVWNMVNAAWLLGTPLEGRVVTGAVLGFSGIALVFWPEVAAFTIGDEGLLGLGLCLGATLLASLGNITSAANQRRGLPVVQTNAYGMGYGGATMILISALRGSSFAVELTLPYALSMFYLTIFGSIVAFGCYLTLLGRIGAGKAAYATLLFPLVALGLSTIFEGYTWSGPALIGVGLILAGNVLALNKSGNTKKTATSEQQCCQDAAKA